MATLAINSLGRFRVAQNDAPIADDAWVTQKTKTLCKLLVTARGRALTKEQLIEKQGGFVDTQPSASRERKIPWMNILATLIALVWFVLVGLSAKQWWGATGEQERFWLAILGALILIPPVIITFLATIRTKDEHKKLFWIAALYIAILFLVMGVVSIAIWDKKQYFVAFAPVSVLEWAFLGGMASVLYRLAHRRNQVDTRFYIWIVTKPIIGMVMGALVYFIALGGGLLLGAPIPTDKTGQLVFENRQYWLHALAFIGGFSDRFSIDLIKGIASKSVDEIEQKNDDKIEKPSQEK